MGVEIVTKKDLQLFSMELVNDFKTLITQIKSSAFDNNSIEGYKTKHVRKLLDCSTNKLQSLRIAGKLRYKKVGGTIYYKKEDVNKLLNEGF